MFLLARVIKLAVLINFASSQSFLNSLRGGNFASFENFNPFGSVGASFNPQSLSLDRIGTSNTFYNTFQNQNSKVQNNPTFGYTRSPDRYPTNDREAQFIVQSSPNAFGRSHRNLFNSYENRGTHIQNKPTFQVTEFGDRHPKTERDAQRYLEETRRSWANRRNPFDSEQTQEAFRRLNHNKKLQSNGGIFKKQISTIHQETQALNSNRYIPKDLCSTFSLNGFASSGADPYFDTSVLSRESIKARFKNLDIVGIPTEITAQSSRATDKFNTFSNQNSFIENEPRYDYIKSGNFFRPSTKIGQEAELKSQEIMWENARKYLFPQTAAGRNFLREELKIPNTISPELFRESNTLKQVMNENREARRRLRSQYCDEKYISFNNRNTQIQNNQRHLVTDNLFKEILPRNAEDALYLLRRQEILWRNTPNVFRGFFS